jgi:imidazolonepropionase-like amidohydrolase
MTQYLFTYKNAHRKWVLAMMATIPLYLLMAQSGVAQPHFPYNGVRDSRPGAWYLSGATIVKTAGDTIRDGAMLIRDGRIEAVGRQIPKPDDAREVELRGKFIYPAFLEPAANYGMEGLKAQRAQRGSRREEDPVLLPERVGAWNANDAVRADQNVGRVFAVKTDEAEKWRKAGYGAVLTHPHDGIVRGTGAWVSTADVPEGKAILLPAASTHYSFDKGSSRQDYPSSLMGSIALIRQTHYDLQWYARQEPGGRVYDQSLEAMQHSDKLPKVFETPRKFDVLRVASIAKEFGFPFIATGTGEEYQYVNEIKATGAALLLPVNFPEPMDVQDPFDARDAALSAMMHWEMAPSNPAILHRAGIPFALTTRGLKSPDELLSRLRTAIERGLPASVALEALTATPARLFGAESFMGKIEKGYLGQIIVCSHPLFDPENRIQETWIGSNRYYNTEDELQVDLRGVYRLNRIEWAPEDGRGTGADKGAATGSTAGVTESLRGWQLVIGGKRSGYEAAMRASDTARSVGMSVRQRQGFLSLSLQDSNIAQGQLLRIGAWRDERSGLSARLELPDGSTWQLGFDSIAPHSPDTTARKPGSAPTIPAESYRYPFADLGHEEMPRPVNWLITGATVWTSSAAGIVREADVAVRDGKILAIVPAGSAIPSTLFGKGVNYSVRDAKGLHLTPGIIDEHSHIAITRGVNEGTRSITSEVRIGDVLNPDDVNIYRQLAGGVTTAQLLHGSANAIGGQSAIVQMRWGVTHPDSLKFRDAPGFIKFALGENVKQSNWGDRQVVRFPQTRMGVEQVMMDGFLRAREYAEKRRLQPRSTRRDLTLDALVEILRAERFITCHSYVQSEINMLMKVADSLGFKVNTFTHILEGYKVADKMKQHGVSASSFADWWAYKYEVVDAIPYNAAILQRVGVNVAINSDDAEMARRLNQEAAKTMKYGGLTEEQALKTVTINPARALHIDHKVGSIEVGKQADLVLWSAHPLSMYARPLLTLIEGTPYFDLVRDEAARIRRDRERQKLVAELLKVKGDAKGGNKPRRKVEPQWHCETLGEDGESTATW